jgi:hypothetical protein
VGLLSVLYQRKTKPIIVELVGWETSRPLLKGEAAYDVAYETIYRRLPDCKHESNVFCI